MSGDLKTEVYNMFVKYFVIFLVLTGTIACRNNSEKVNPASGPDKLKMEDLNRYFVQKDRERIQSYCERKNLKMKESPTGLWYLIKRDGAGENYSDNDKVIMSFECSLLDGTTCYSSADLGPKVVIIGKTEMEAGLNEALRMLKPGAEAIFIIPPFLAYGLIGDKKRIPPRAVIVYNINILQPE
jgi:FKBP-type peptidyl-prolyl cis-trans isomerase FkpA